jgi:hypothetical protein
MPLRCDGAPQAMIADDMCLHKASLIEQGKQKEQGVGCRPSERQGPAFDGAGRAGGMTTRARRP